MDSAPVVQKASIRFAKTGFARFHSHHDLIRFWERAVRRAGWPLRFTAGHNPRPRLVFPHALGVGVISRCEEVEVELRAKWPLPRLRETIRDAARPTLEVEGVTILPPVRSGRRVKSCLYRIGGWPEGMDRRRIADAAASLLARPSIQVQRGPSGQSRMVDIRPYLESIAVDGAPPEVQVRLRHTPAGAGRIDETARLLAMELSVDPWRLSSEKTEMALVFC